MRRRATLILCGILLGGAAVSSPCAARAQQPALPVIGFLSGASPASFAHLVAAFHAGLAEAGFVEGQNVAVEYRWAQGDYARIPALAAELVSEDVVMALASGGDPPARAAKAATATIPIVFTGSDDPVGFGHAGRILKGAKPSDLPVRQATRFELVLNLGTAQTSASRCRRPSCCAPTR